MGRQRMILLIEDDQVDAMTVKRALADMGSSSSIVHVNNGELALAYLQSKLNERPYLILLDINMPKMNGIEFLRQIKADPDLKSIPVVVLTTSSSQDDIGDSYKASVAGYIIKSVDYRQFVAKIQAIERYWQINRLPGDQWEAYHAGIRTHLVS